MKYELNIDFPNYSNQVVTDVLSFENVRFPSGIEVKDAFFKSNVKFTNCRFSDIVSLESVVFSEEVEFIECEFENSTFFDNSIFEKQVVFDKSIFHDNTYFRSAIFKWDSKFNKVKFDKNANFRSCKFHGYAVFTESIFRKRVKFLFSEFHDELRLDRVKFGLLKNLDAKNVLLDGSILEESHLWNIENMENYSLKNSFLLAVSFAGMKINNCDFTGAVFYATNLRGAEIDGQTIKNTKYIYTDFTRDEDLDEYGPKLESRIPAYGEFGDADNSDFTLLNVFQEATKVHFSMNVPKEFRTTVINYFNFFCDFVRITQGIDTELVTKREGARIRVDFLANSTDDVATLKASFAEYLKKATLDSDELLVDFTSSPSTELEQKILIIDLKHQVSNVQTKLLYTRELLTQEKEINKLKSTSELEWIDKMSSNPSVLLNSYIPTLPSTSDSLSVFISYSRSNTRMREALEKHLSNLKNLNVLNTFHDLDLDAGDEWDPKILTQLKASKIVLLLVSAEFLASSACQKETSLALENQQKGLNIVVPIILRDCNWKNADFAKFNVLPKNSHSVASSKWKNHDEAYTDIVTNLELLVKKKYDSSEKE
jgi:uncharacterized protein YjbI with pentapeptide repeats